jgi:hypothetical protein
VKLYITDDEARDVALADNIQEAAELLFVNEKDKVESITPCDNYYKVIVVREHGWATIELVDEYELENHKVYP